MRRLRGVERAQMPDRGDHMDVARHVRSFVKGAVASLLYRTGVLSLLARRRLKGRAVVLMYHRVLPAELARESFSHAGLVVTPATFARQMAFLKREFRLLSLAEFQQYMESGPSFPDRSCLVTFDDGWVDNHEYALPILRKHGIPAVVFVATDYIDAGRPFWQEYLGHLLYQAACRGLGESALRACDVRLPSPEDDAGLRRAVAATIDRFRSDSYENIDALIEKLVQALSSAAPDRIAPPPDRFMTWPQLRALSGGGVTVASHSGSHRLLTRLDQATVKSELARSREALAAGLGRDACALAYPGGSYDTRVRQSAIEARYRLGFTTNPGMVSATSDPLLIARVNIHESSTATIPLFLCRVLGIF